MSPHGGATDKSGGRKAAAGSLRWRCIHHWRRFWLMRAGTRGMGRLAAWLASRHLVNHHQAACLADLKPSGFVAPGARLSHPELRLGKHVYLGDRVVVYSTSKGGPIVLEDAVQIYGNTFIETGMGGSIHIGKSTHVQPGCHFHAFISAVRIGTKVEIAPNCGFYCYDHGTAHGIPIMDQQLTSKGDVVVGNGAWIGYGAVILQGVTIGEGAVIAAGAVVTRDIPANAIAAGSPAKVIRFRDGSQAASTHPTPAPTP